MAFELCTGWVREFWQPTSATDAVALQNIFVIRDIRVIRGYSDFSENVDRDVGFSIHGVEREFLS